MNLWFRMLGVLIASIVGRRLGIFGQSTLSFRVWPHDLDINVHMNNARYLALMDLGRLDLIVRCGLWRGVLKSHWQPVIGGSLVRYRRPLRPFQAFLLRSRLLTWDDRWLYIEHRIEADGVLACHTVVRGAFVGKMGIVPPDEVVALSGGVPIPPPVPGWVAAWREAETQLEQAPSVTATGETLECAL